MNSRLTLWIIVAVILFGLWVNLPPLNLPDRVTLLNRTWSLSWLHNGFGLYPIKLGLDLQGGSELTLDTDMSKIAEADKDTALESARQVIERRVNLYGVSEAVVQSARVGNSRRILVELPGIKDASAAAQLVGQTAQLDFREQPASLSAEEIAATQSGVPDIYFYQSTGLGGSDLLKAQVVYSAASGNTGPQVEIQFNDAGTKKFAEITKRNVGKPLAMFLDNQPITYPPPVVLQELDNGVGVITGNFTADEAKQLAIQLNAGALPVPITIAQQRTIGATLGSQSVQRSLVAAVVGIGTVMLFMVAYYGLYGLLADLALVIYALVTFAVMRFFSVTLSLAGVAGFVLSIGMAVDANILIFERMKEEARSGKTGRTVLNLGFNRAWSSIRDSNISSLITAGILFSFGTSVVRGFALTLAIGVLVSMFSAIMVSRTLLSLLPRFRR